MREVNRTAICACLVVLVMGGCDSNSADKTTAQEPAKSPSNAEESRIAALEGQLSILSNLVLSLDTAHMAEHTNFKSGIFDPGNTQYQRIDPKSGLGSFAVSVADVRPLGDGVRVTMQFGNPSAAGFEGVKVTIKYGTRAPEQSQGADFYKAYNDWNQSLKAKEETILQRLQPGSWNPVQVTLPGISADKFGYMEVTMETNTITLAK